MFDFSISGISGSTSGATAALPTTADPSLAAPFQDQYKAPAPASDAVNLSGESSPSAADDTDTQPALVSSLHDWMGGADPSLPGIQGPVLADAAAAEPPDENRQDEEENGYQQGVHGAKSLYKVGHGASELLGEEAEPGAAAEAGASTAAAASTEGSAGTLASKLGSVSKTVPFIAGGAYLDQALDAAHRGDYGTATADGAKGALYDGSAALEVAPRLASAGVRAAGALAPYAEFAPHLAVGAAAIDSAGDLYHGIKNGDPALTTFGSIKAAGTGAMAYGLATGNPFAVGAGAIGYGLGGFTQLADEGLQKAEADANKSGGSVIADVARYNPGM